MGVSSSIGTSAVVRVPFCFFLKVAVSSSTAIIASPLNPASGIISTGSTRLPTLSLLYDSFRFTELMISIPPFEQITGVQVVGVAYTDDVITTTPPTTLTNVLEFPCVAWSSDSQTTPVRLRVPRRYLLKNGLKWWKINSASDTFESTQGTIYSRADASFTGSISFVVQGVCEFKDPVSLSVSQVRMLRELSYPTEERKVEEVPEELPQGVPTEFSSVRLGLGSATLSKCASPASGQDEELYSSGASSGSSEWRLVPRAPSQKVCKGLRPP